MQTRATGIKKDEHGYDHNNERKEGIDFLEEKKINAFHLSLVKYNFFAKHNHYKTR